jgi:hypothetical protein
MQRKASNTARGTLEKADLRLRHYRTAASAEIAVLLLRREA